MDLKEFVASSLKQVIDGIHDAQDYVEETGSSSQIVSEHPIDRRRSHIEFDVAVTAESSSTAEGKAGITVFSIGASTEGQVERLSSTASRIKFRVPVNLPIQGGKRKR